MRICRPLYGNLCAAPTLLSARPALRRTDPGTCGAAGTAQPRHLAAHQWRPGAANQSLQADLRCNQKVLSTVR